jgi:putative ABC transport system substrate-binding protein
MKRKIIGLALSSLFLAFSIPADAQQPKKAPRIGYLSSASSDAQSARLDAFRQKLGEHGWVEGQNIAVEYRFADGNLDRITELAAGLIRSGVDVIVVSNNGVGRTVRQLTQTIPIVLTGGSDPVLSHLVASLAHPGGNVTGVTGFLSALGAKRLELLKETVPKLVRVAALVADQGSGQELKEIKSAAPPMHIQLQILTVRDAGSLETEIARAIKTRAGAITVTPDATGLFQTNRKQIIELAAKNKLPAIYPLSSFANTGGLMSYAANDIEIYRRAATFVDKILKGAKPADLPVEQPMKFEFIINLKAAKQIGLRIPPNVLARADRVIK